MPLAGEEIFCPRCQLVRADCSCDAIPADISLHSLSVTTIEQRVNGDSGDTGVSPAGGPVASTNLPAVTAVTHPAPKPGRHARAVTTAGDSRGALVTAGNGQRRTAWTAADLLAEQFPEPRWAVPGLFPEGVTLLAGAPKVGKSWLCLGLALAVASGGKALGSIDVEQGSALYLALEDTPRRLQKRLRHTLSGSAAPEHLTIAVECPPGEAGMLRIAKWIESPHALPPRLIIIDVLERIRGQAAPGISAYQADYRAIAMIKQVADVYGISIMVITHVRKVTADDFLSEISGTLGLSGAADTICALKRARGEMDGVLHVTGRDVEEEAYALSYAADLGAWQLIGLESEHGLADSRRKILSFLRLHDGSKPSEIAIGTQLSRDLVRQTCRRMASDGQLDTDNTGRYYLPPTTEPQ